MWETKREEAQALLTRVTNGPIREYSTYDFGRERDERCLSAILPAERARAARSVIRGRLPTGVVSFLGTSRWLGEERNDGIELAVGPGESQLDILRLAHTDGINQGLDTAAIVAKLREYDESVGITIFATESDKVEFALSRHPGDLAAFADDLHAFCPDIVDQGVGSVEAVAEMVAFMGHITLWWD